MTVPEIILGPPGCGKTTALIGIVEEELERGTAPDRIGFFSFTRKAATEAMDRACQKFSMTRKDFPFFSTIHSLAYRQLGLQRGDVLEGQRLQRFAHYAGVRISGKFSEDGTLSGFDLGDRAMFMENLARIRGRDLRELYDEGDDRLNWSEVSRIARCLRVFKAAHGLMDFTDMLSEFVRSGIRLGLEVLLVDEDQDLSWLQHQVIARLAEGCRRFAVAGDDDQGIYAWAGADVNHLISMEGDVRVLGQSWRVPPVVQRIAGRVIREVKYRREKKWEPRQSSVGTVERAAKIDEVEADDPWGDEDKNPPVLVLARNTYVLREQVEPELRRRGVIYERHGHPSISDRTLSVIRDWERLRKGGKIRIAEARFIYEQMSSGLGVSRGHKTLSGEDDEREISAEELRADHGLLRNDPWYDALDRLPRDDVGYLRAALKRGERPGGRPRVIVSTIHGSKGGEAHHVILMKEMAGRTWREMGENPEDEARCWYVGVTRAREKLTIVESSNGRRCPWL